MKLDRQQIAAIEGRLKGSIKNKRWPNGIVVYEIDSSLGEYCVVALLWCNNLVWHLIAVFWSEACVVFFKSMEYRLLTDKLQFD